MKDDTNYNLVEKFFDDLAKNNIVTKPQVHNRYIKLGKRQVIMIASLIIILLLISFICWRSSKAMNAINAHANNLKECNDQLRYALKLKQLLNEEKTMLPLYGKRMQTKLDNLIAANVKKKVSAAIRAIAGEDLLKKFLEGKILECLKSFKIYLILSGLEASDNNLIQTWYNNNLENIASHSGLSINEAMLLTPYIQSQANNLIELDLNLYNKIIAYFQTNIFSNTLFQYLHSSINKADGHLSDLVPKNLVYLFDDQIQNTNIQYIYTKKGYADFKKMLSKFAQTIKSIQHLNNTLGSNYIEDLNKEVEEIFLSNYQANWYNVLKKLKYASINNLNTSLINLSHIKNNISGVIHVIEQIEAKMLIMQTNLDSLKINLSPQDISAATKDPKQKIKNNVTDKLYNTIIEYTPIKKRNIVELKNTIEANLENNLTEISDILIINNAEEKYATILEKINSDEFFIKKSLQVSKLLPNPLNEMHAQLTKEIGNLLKEDATNHINAIWKQEIYSYYKEQIANKYPFNSSNYHDQLTLEEFNNFFGPEGQVALFKKHYLDKNAVVLSQNAKQALKTFSNISKFWFNRDGELSITFAITNLELATNLKSINFFLLDKSLSVNSSFNEPSVYTLQYGLKGIAKVEFFGKKKHQISHLSYIGPWGWYKMLKLDEQSNTPHEHLIKTISSPVGDIIINLYFRNRFMPLPQSLQKIIPKTIT